MYFKLDVSVSGSEPSHTSFTLPSLSTEAVVPDPGDFKSAGNGA